MYLNLNGDVTSSSHPIWTQWRPILKGDFRFVNILLASFCHFLITFANCLDTDHARLLSGLVPIFYIRHHRQRNLAVENLEYSHAASCKWTLSMKNMVIG